MRTLMRYTAPLAAALLAAACGNSAQPAAEATTATPAAATHPGADTLAPASAPTSAPAATAVRPSPSASPPGLGGRSGELVNPDESTMVLLYHELAGIAPPLDQWVESDSRVTTAAGPEKAARRSQVRAELQAAAAAVRDTGFIRLSLNDNLSDYDPGYGEYTLRALAPSSTVSYRALQQEVTLRFGNGRDAQVWAVSSAEAQIIDDSFRYGRAVVLDLQLKLTGVQPAPRGGTLVADVLEYEIRAQRGNKLLGRVHPARR